MKARNITYAAVSASAFIILSMVAISTGIAYSLYLDIIVPIFICTAYLKLGRKYTFLMAVTSLSIVFFILGDIISLIWMSQGIILGIICTYFIKRDESVLDDFIYSSICGIFVIVLIDIYFSKITGYSLIKDSQEIFNSMSHFFSIYNINVPSFLYDLTIYFSVSLLSLGTMLVVFIGSLFLGSKLGILDKNTAKKYKLIKNFKQYGSLLCCSKATYINALIYIIVVELFKIFNVKIDFIYLKVVIMSVEVICYYFVIKDSLSVLYKYIIIKFKSKLIYQISLVTSIILLLNCFNVFVVAIIIGYFLINKKFNLIERQFKILEKSL